MRSSFVVFVPALTAGKGRPRATKTGRMYTPAATRNAELRIEMAWELAGSPRLMDGPCAVNVVVYLDRPMSHFRVNGEPSKAGLASVFPTRKPDVDNTLKLALDALNGLAWKDDVMVVEARVCKRWADDMPLDPVAGLSIEAHTMSEL